MSDQFIKAAEALFRVLLATTTVFIVVCAMTPLAERVPLATYWDKLNHAVAFATLTLLGTLSFPTKKPVILAPILLILGVLIELVQLIPSLKRSAEFGDVLADAVGIAVGYIGINILRFAATRYWPSALPLIAR